MQIAPGTVIDNRFKVLAPLGKGGMGAVYSADQLDLERSVAIKFLLDLDMAEAEAFARFQQEAQIISRLQHKNIVAVYAFGKWQNTPYMVMEIVDGTTLQLLLKDNKPLEEKLAADVLQQVCAGLEVAHAAGVVHRDLKPSNIIVAKNGEAKVIDFGFAKLLDPKAHQQKLTEAGAAVGSVLYMSPEQCTGMQVCPRADIYALGCVLHHCLTGAPPFQGDHSLVIMMHQLNDPLPRIANVGFQTVIDNATAKEAKERYESTGQMAEDLRRVVDNQSVVLRAAPAVPRNKQKKQSTHRLAVVCAAGFVLLAGLAAGDLVKPQAPTSSTGANADKIRALNEKIADLDAKVDLTRDSSVQSQYRLQLADLYAQRGKLENDRRAATKANVVRNAISAVNLADPKDKTAVLMHLSGYFAGPHRAELLRAAMDVVSDGDKSQNDTHYRMARQRYLGVVELLEKLGDRSTLSTDVAMRATVGLIQGEAVSNISPVTRDADMARCAQLALKMPMDTTADLYRVYGIADAFRQANRKVEAGKLLTAMEKNVFAPNRFQAYDNAVVMGVTSAALACDLPGCEERAQTAVKLVRERGGASSVEASNTILISLADYAQLHGRYAEAIQKLEQLQLGEGQATDALRLCAANIQCAAHSQIGDWEKSRKCNDRALELVDKIPDETPPDQQIQAYLSAVGVAHHFKDSKRMQEMSDRALDEAKDFHDTLTPKRVNFVLGQKRALRLH